MYSFDDVCFKYSEYILRDFNLEIKEKKIGIVGQNGAGKTTLLKLMGGELTPQSGRISIPGDSYFVHFDLIKYKKFTLNDMLDLCRGLKSFNYSRCIEYMQVLNISSFLDVPIGKLSKGTTKKVALLFGLLSLNPILLIDEPFESLDENSNKNLIQLFREEERGLVIVSHDISMLNNSVDKIYQLKNKGLNKYEDRVLQ